MYRLRLKRFAFIFCLKEENDVAPDLDLVADVIDHIHRFGEPGKNNFKGAQIRTF